MNASRVEDIVQEIRAYRTAGIGGIGVIGIIGLLCTL
jgi:hypothetical protein